MTPEAGELAPDFELKDQHGAAIRLSSLRGEKAVVLMFYPFAFSGVCTGELHEVRDRLGEFAARDAAVLAVSCDPMFSLRAYADHDKLELPLLSDFWPHGEVAKTYGVLDEKRGCARRSTYIVDTEGTVRWSVHNAMPEARDLDEQLAVLDGLARDATGPAR